MTDKPATTYIVSVFEKPHWRTVLTTQDKQKAFDLAKEIGDIVRIETITPKPNRIAKLYGNNRDPGCGT